jgi:small subunit ribosomal protein S29e
VISVPDEETTITKGKDGSITKTSKSTFKKVKRVKKGGKIIEEEIDVDPSTHIESSKYETDQKDEKMNVIIRKTPEGETITETTLIPEDGSHTTTTIIKGDDGSISKTTKTTTTSVKKTKKSKKGGKTEEVREDIKDDDDDEIGELKSGKKTTLVSKTISSQKENDDDDEIGELKSGKKTTLVSKKVIAGSSNDDEGEVQIGKRTVLKSKKKTIPSETLTQTIESEEVHFEEPKKDILKSKVKKPITASGGNEEGRKNYFEEPKGDLSSNYRRGKYDKYSSTYNQVQSIKILSDGSLQLPHHYRTHPRLYGKDARYCRVCRNTHGLIRKYGLDICRRCFRERYVLLGFKQTK